MKYQTRTTNFVNYNDLDRAISEFLKEKGAKNTQFEVVAYEELGNDSDKAFNIGKYDFSLPDESDKADILNGKLHYQTGRILEWMCAEGKIPAGDYVVEISW